MRPETMLDCGAFSLFKGRHGKPIEPEDLIDFHKRNEDYIDLSVSLDVIAGADGDRRSRALAADHSGSGQGGDEDLS